MKAFYAITAVVMLALAASPFALLEAEDESELEGKVVLWDTYGAAVKSIDPATCGDTTSSSIQGNIYEGLYAYHYLKRPPTVVPQLATEVAEPERYTYTDRDGREQTGESYTIRIKPDVLYHRNRCFGVDDEGRAKTRTVRAEDFVLAFKRIADYHIDTGLAWAFLAGRIEGLDAWRQRSRYTKAGDFSRYDRPVSGLEVLDERTFRIKLTKPYPQFTYVLAMHVYAPIPREAIDYWLGTEDDGDGGRRPIDLTARSTEFKQPEQVVGTGPYLLDDWQRKHRIVLKRNPDFREDYYPTEGAPGDKPAGLLDDAGKRVPFIDIVRYKFVAEPYSSWMLFLTKRKDATGIPKETFDMVITPGRELTDTWRKRHIYLRKYTSPSVYWVVFNMEDPVLGASPSLRQALCLCYDVENHIKVLHNNRGKRAVNIIPSTIEGHDAAGPGPHYRLDMEAARRKLEDAKAELRKAGQLVDGRIPELRLELGDRSANATRLADFARQQFGKLGLRVKVVYNDWPTLQKKVHNKQAQMYMMGWHADYPDAENFLQLFYSGNIDKGTNNANYRDARFDELYEKVRTMRRSPERTRIYAELANIISRDCPVLLLSEPESFVLFYDWVHNVKPHPIGYGFLKYRRIDTDLRRKLGGGR